MTRRRSAQLLAWPRCAVFFSPTMPETTADSIDSLAYLQAATQPRRLRLAWLGLVHAACRRGLCRHPVRLSRVAPVSAPDGRSAPVRDSAPPATRTTTATDRHCRLSSSVSGCRHRWPLRYSTVEIAGFVRWRLGPQDVASGHLGIRHGKRRAQHTADGTSGWPLCPGRSAADSPNRKTAEIPLPSESLSKNRTRYRRVMRRVRIMCIVWPCL